MYPPQQPPGYHPPAAPPPPPKRSTSRTLLIAVGVIGSLCVVGMMGANKEGGPATSGTSPATVPPLAATPPSVEAVVPSEAPPSAPTPAPAIAAPSPPPAPAPAPAPSATGESAEDAVPVGMPVSVAGLEATVLRARLTRRVSHQFFRHVAPEGSTLLILSYRVRNTTHEPIQALSFADAVLAGGSSYEPSQQCAMAVNTLGIADTLNPNLPRTFEACFEVPPDMHGVVVKFNRSLTDRFAQTGL